MEFQKPTIWDFFINHYRFTFIVAAAILLFGLLAVVQLPKESDPEVDVPVAVIVTPFPGAAPEDVEELVTDVIEDKLASISGIDDLTSVSRNGLSQITVEFDVDTDRAEVIGDVKDVIDEAKPELPEDAEEPILSEVSISDQAFMQLSLGGPFTVPEITQFANRVKEQAERVSGVSAVRILGGQDPEIQVIVDKAKLDAFGIGINQVTRAISFANSDIPVGAIETAGESFNVRLAGRLSDATSVEAVPVGVIDGTPVLVSDVAIVRAGFTETSSVSRLSADNEQSQPAVTLLAFKQSGGDITEISDAIRQEMETLIAEEFPEGVEYVFIYDLAEFIRADLSSLSRNGFATIVIVFLILYLILGGREAIMAGIAIPLSFLMTFAYLLTIGLSINFMTLFSLILSLGILVDSAIVINEGMNREIKRGLPPFDAAKKVVREYQWPLIAGTLTTVFAFVPMLLTSGIIGEYIRSIPITVSGVLISSLFVALALVTTTTAVIATYQQKKPAPTNGARRRKERIDAFVVTMQDRYKHMVGRLLNERRLQKKLVRWTIVGIIFSYSLPVIGALRIEMFPTSNEPQFAIDYEMPIGTPIERTSALLERVEDVLQEDPLVTSYVVNVGGASGLGSVSTGSNAHQGFITVNLVEDNRPRSIDVVEDYQETLDTLGGPGTFRVSQGNFGPPNEAPVVVTITGDNLDTLDKLAGEFKNLLGNIEGTRNVDSSVAQTNGEFVLNVNRATAQRFGLSTTDIAFALRNAVNGTVATSINQDGEDVEIVVRTALNPDVLNDEKAEKTDIETLRGLSFATQGGDIPLGVVADISLENSRSQVRHQDGSRIARVTSFTEEGASAFVIFGEVQNRMDEIDIPTGYAVQLGGDNEDINQSFADMFRAMILAVFMIAALLVLQFNSFKQSLIILVTIPLALIGVFPGLALLGLPLSFPGIIGIVALVGIVVNNAIILIDKINKNRQSGMEDAVAITEAGESRLKPIVMTTITTVLGIMPLALTEEVWRSLGFAIVFGLLFSTFLTLFYVPMLYKKWIKA